MKVTMTGRIAALTGAFLLLAVTLCACASVDTRADTPAPTPTVSESPVATPSTTPAPTVSATPEPEPTPEPVTFTYDCYIIHADGTDEPAQFATLREIWADPAIKFCTPIRHGDIVTEQQARAVDLAEAAYGGDREHALEGLHTQCAITDNGYIDIPRLSGFQDEEVRGMLELCPDRPGADKLRSALPEG